MKLRYGGGANGYEILSAVSFSMAYVNHSKALVVTELHHVVISTYIRTHRMSR